MLSVPACSSVEQRWRQALPPLFLSVALLSIYFERFLLHAFRMTASAVVRIAIFCAFCVGPDRLCATQRALCGVHRRTRTGNECRVPHTRLPFLSTTLPWTAKGAVAATKRMSLINHQPPLVELLPASPCHALAPGSRISRHALTSTLPGTTLNCNITFYPSSAFTFFRRFLLLC